MASTLRPTARSARSTSGTPMRRTARVVSTFSWARREMIGAPESTHPLTSKGDRMKTKLIALAAALAAPAAFAAPDPWEAPFTILIGAYSAEATTSVRVDRDDGRLGTKV